MKRLTMIVMAVSLTLAASAAFAVASYEMVILPPPVGGAPQFYRIDVATGQVMSVGTALVLTKDASLPQGSYHLYQVASPDAKSYWVYRMDSQSGRVWFLQNGVWTEVAAPK
jgi:hypothetical protein